MSLNDVSDAFEGWEIELIVSRNTGAYVSGRWVENTPLQKSFMGVVQNATPDDLLVLEEGLRTTESIKIHTKYPLAAQDGNSRTGDTIAYNSNNYLVHNVAPRFIGNYYKAIALRQ